MKYKVLLILLVLVGKVSSQNTFDCISKNIYSKQSKIKGVSLDLLDKFHNIRMEEEVRLQVESQAKLDTIFVLEAFDVTDGSYYGKLWNTEFDINYIYSGGQFEFSNLSTFTPFICSLVELWDLKKIRREEKKEIHFTNPLTIYGSLVVRKKGDYKIKCIMFREFYDFERDHSHQ